MSNMVGGEMCVPERSISHVIFDMDGLLLDTEQFYTDVQQKILARFGKKFEWSLKSKMMGKKALEAGQVLVTELGLEGQITPEEFIAERESMLESLFPNSELLPGVDRLVRHLHSHGVPMAVATSSHKRHFELKTTNHGDLIALMHHVVVGDDPAVTKGKPSPEIFLTAFDQFQEPHLMTEHVLVFEDAPSGVGAARAASMPVVMVPHKNLDPKLHEGADQWSPEKQQSKITCTEIPEFGNIFAPHGSVQFGRWPLLRNILMKKKPVSKRPVSFQRGNVPLL